MSRDYNDKKIADCTENCYGAHLTIGHKYVAWHSLATLLFPFFLDLVNKLLLISRRMIVNYEDRILYIKGDAESGLSYENVFLKKGSVRGEWI